MKQLFIFLFFLPLFSFTQTTPPTTSPNNSQNNSQKKDGRTFRGVTLLSTFDTVQKALDSDSLIKVKPQSDFEDFDEKNPNWIVAEMPPLMDNIYYHFYNDKLYVISIFFNKERTSYAELYQKLKLSYGNPKSMTANQSIWEIDKNTEVVLDSLPSIKYIDKSVFTILADNSTKKDPIETLNESEHKMEEQIKNDL